MSPISDRLRQAREARYDSAAEAARALGVAYPTYAAHEGGHRGFNAQAPRYARFFGVHLVWLMTGQGPIRTSEKPPVLKIYDDLPKTLQAEAL